MLIDLYSSLPSIAQILCMLTAAGLIGFFFNHLLTKKKWNHRFMSIENKFKLYELKLRELDEIKDKQGLLFKNTKDMTLKINELDALLGLTNEVDTISKTLNSLNFVSSKEFNSYADENSRDLKEAILKINNEVSSLEATNNEKIDGLNSIFDEKFNYFETNYTEKFNEFDNKNQQTIEDGIKSVTEFKEFLNNEFINFSEKNITNLNKIKSDMNNKLRDITGRWDINITNNTNNIVSIEEGLKMAPWKAHVQQLSEDLKDQKNIIVNLNNDLSLISEFEKSFTKYNTKYSVFEDKLNDMSENYHILTKQGEQLESFSQKLNLYGKSINELSELEASVIDMKQDVFTFSKKSTENSEFNLELLSSQKDIKSDFYDFKNKSNQLYAKVINFDEEFKYIKNSLKNLKNHSHKEYEDTGLKDELENLKTKQKSLYLEIKKQEVDLMHIKGQVGETLTIVPTLAKTRKRKKMIDKLSIKNIKVSSRDKDDLKLIKGVGPQLEKKINKLGIYTFEQISNLTRSDILIITEAIEFFPGRITRDDWRGQAKKLEKQKAS